MFLSGNKAMLPGQPSKERGSARRSNATDVMNYRGNVINLPNLLQSLESSKTAQRELEKCVATLQSRLGETVIRAGLKDIDLRFLYRF